MLLRVGGICLSCFPDCVIGIFHQDNPSGSTMALGSTQTLREMISKIIYRGKKAAVAYGSQPYHLLVLIVSKSDSLKLVETSGTVIVYKRIVTTLNSPVCSERDLCRFHSSRSSGRRILNVHCNILMCVGSCIIVITEEYKPTRCYLLFYRTSYRLNIHNQELTTIMLITTLVVSFLGCCRLEVRCG